MGLVGDGGLEGVGQWECSRSLAGTPWQGEGERGDVSEDV